MKRISNTIIKRFAALNYEYPQNKILAGFDANNIYANDLIINKSSRLEKPFKNFFYPSINTSNTIPYKNYLFTEYPCNYSIRSNSDAEDLNRNYKGCKIERTPLWKNSSYINVLDKNLREKSGTLYPFQNTDNVNHYIKIDYIEPDSSSTHTYNVAITLMEGSDLSNIVNSTTKLYANIISPVPNTANSLYTGLPSVLHVDTVNKYIYLLMYVGYVPSATVTTYYAQGRTLYRIPYQTISENNQLLLGDYEYLPAPQSQYFYMLYMHGDNLFFCGYSNAGNPVYIRAIEKDATGNYSSWYNATPSYTDTHNQRYLVFEHSLTSGVIATIDAFHDFNSTNAWGLGASVLASANRITGAFSPTHFEQTAPGSDVYVSYFPAFNTSNQFPPIGVFWDKAANTFQFKLLPTSIQATIKNEYQDVHEDATPYVYSYPSGPSGTTISLSLKLVSPIVMEIVTGELGNKYLTVYNDLYNDRMRAYCTSTGVRNMVTFQISNNWETLTHVQTTELDALFTLPLNQDRTKLASAESINASLWSFNEVNYWQKVSTTPAICYFLVKKDDSSFYAVTLNNDTLSSQSITEYPERRYITSEILEISANQAELTININTGDSVSYNGSPLNKSIFVDALSNGQRVIQDVTLTIDSDQAVFAGPPEANMITITTSDTESTEVPLILNSPGAIIISAKFTDLEV